ncbi:MAG: hypothetical protein IKN72_06010 [Clostridia bacterium]|nr:hypothetical protein [Clostridia bacterium]
MKPFTEMEVVTTERIRYSVFYFLNGFAAQHTCNHFKEAMQHLEKLTQAGNAVTNIRIIEQRKVIFK